MPAGAGDADPFELVRFLREQGATHQAAVRELRTGRKVGHWIWYEFPQLAGLGRSATARRFGITGLNEARAYLAHPSLRANLVELAEALLGNGDRTAEEILGGVDAMKVRSSMTLFHRAEPDEPVFRRVLDSFYGGVPDARTEALLAHD